MRRRSFLKAVVAACVAPALPEPFTVPEKCVGKFYPIGDVCDLLRKRREQATRELGELF